MKFKQLLECAQNVEKNTQAEEDEADPDDATVIFQRRDKDD